MSSRKMGGIAVFKVGDQQITVLHNRENWEKRVITAAAWDDEDKMMAGRCIVNKGLWCGASKRGRFVILVDSWLHDDRRGVRDISEDDMNMISWDFLKQPEGPLEFEKLSVLLSKIGGVEDPRGVTFNLIVGDSTPGTVYHILKPEPNNQHIQIQEVQMGVHTLSLEGLDAASPRDKRVRQLFDASIGDFYCHRISLGTLAERVMSDRVETVPGNRMSAVFAEKFETHPDLPELGRQRYGTTSTTAFHAISYYKDNYYTMDTN